MLKISENAISLTNLYSSAQTFCLRGANTAAKNVRRSATIFMVLASFLERTIYPVWNIDQKKRYF